MNYIQISKKTMSHLLICYNSLKDSSLDQELRALIEIKTSLINQCSYCIKLHTKEALELGISQEKISALADFEKTNLYSEKELLAFKWSESVTNLDDKLKKEDLQPHFNEKEIVDLTICISIMNALNRLAKSLKD